MWPVGSMRKFCAHREASVHHESLRFHRPALANAQRWRRIEKRRNSTTHLRFQVPMDVPKLVQFRHAREHLWDVEPRVFLFEDARVVEEGAEVAAGDEVLRKEGRLVERNRGR
jgi:hypothetical protein